MTREEGLKYFSGLISQELDAPSFMYRTEGNWDSSVVLTKEDLYGQGDD